MICIKFLVGWLSWLKAPHSKCGIPVRVSGVQIPLPPPDFFKNDIIIRLCPKRQFFGILRYREVIIFKYQIMFMKILAGVSYLAMVVVNILANALPINNRGTGQISDAYANLFAPAGLTFSIWGLIYLLLAAYVVYQFSVGQKNKNRELLFKKINTYFIISSLANIAWIFSWHYDFIVMSVFIMLIILLSLIKIAEILRLEKFDHKERIFISWPFSVYFGWITVATFANIAVFLVSINWNGFGIADYIWISIILLVGALIGILRMMRDKNSVYLFVFIWAYLGILYKHLSSQGFGGQYSGVIFTVILCIVAFVISLIFLRKKLRLK